MRTLKITKLSRLALVVPILGLVSIATDVNARSQYMFSSGAPSCGACHWVTPEKGLMIERRFDQESGKLTKVGPYVSWPDEDGETTMTAFEKMQEYCNFKLRKKLKKLGLDAANIGWNDKKRGYKCEIPTE